MKRWMWAGLIVLLGLSCLTPTALAAKKTAKSPNTTNPKNIGPALKIPSSTPRLADLSKVMGEAKEKHKPLVIVISQEGSTKKTISQDTMYAMQRARALGLLVYVDAKEIKQLPQNLHGAANDIRNQHPGMVIVDSDTEESVATVRHSAERADWENDLRDARHKIKGGDTAK